MVPSHHWSSTHSQVLSGVTTPNGPLFTPQLPASGAWRKFDEPRPYVTVSGIAYDSKGSFPLIWRSDKVRSAKNCWSIPSGLHEIGYSYAEQFAQELHEELGLTPLVETAHLIGTYENIATVDDWHWCIIIMTMQVKTHDELVNKEPDRHSKVEFLTHYQLLDDHMFNSYQPWAPGLGKFLMGYRRAIANSIDVALHS